MTELERELTTALRELSAQFGMALRQHAEERQRDSEQIEALLRRIERQETESATSRRRIEQLDDLVTDLARAFETLAETLREPWR